MKREKINISKRKRETESCLSNLKRIGRVETSFYKAYSLLIKT